MNYKLDGDDTMFCKCGARIDETQIIAEGTEFESEVELCEKCFEDSIGDNSFVIL